MTGALFPIVLQCLLHTVFVLTYTTPFCSAVDQVAFGDVWKESLTELSGGQRSLVALSLILSLLLFKPAPLYILDEVDAALDLSHTQVRSSLSRRHGTGFSAVTADSGASLLF